MRFSNTVTVEHNVLGAGVVSHILCNRTINPSTGVATDRWFHYDQVGSVLSESNAAGALAQTHHQDAFGNTQAAWQTGLWGGDRAGWHHNTKELDGDTGLVYMHQRWYAPETGTFMSPAPYPVMREHRYGFAENRPGLMVDPDGRFLAAIVGGAVGGVIAGGTGAIGGAVGGMWACGLKYRFGSPEYDRCVCIYIVAGLVGGAVGGAIAGGAFGAGIGADPVGAVGVLALAGFAGGVAGAGAPC
jgi:RHS repeat-associated protein